MIDAAVIKALVEAGLGVCVVMALIITIWTNFQKDAKIFGYLYEHLSITKDSTAAYQKLADAIMALKEEVACLGETKSRDSKRS